MKTPRELLLGRHQAAGPRLDEIRKRVIDSVRSKRPFFALKLWEELILPARHAWMGLAAGWVLILALDLAARGDAGVSVNKPGPPSADSVIALQRKEQLMAQLFKEDEDPSPPAKAPEQRPRSEAPVECKIV
jgi:hypothetical protein